MATTFGDYSIIEPPGYDAIPTGIRAKLERAKECIANLNTEITEFLSRQPSPYYVVGGLNEDGTEYLFKGFGGKPPLRFAVQAGEIIHQVRSCYDHLIVHLVALNGKRPLNNHQFPVCRTPDKFEKARSSGCVKGLTDSALRKVVAKQPYNYATSDNYLLSVIHELDIVDKHRLLLVVGCSARLGQSLTVRGKAEPIRGGLELVENGRVLLTEGGVNVLKVVFQVPQTEVHAEADFAHQVAFAEVGTFKAPPLVEMLAQMIAFTQRVLGEFAEDLS